MVALQLDDFSRTTILDFPFDVFFWRPSLAVSENDIMNSYSTSDYLNSNGEKVSIYFKKTVPMLIPVKLIATFCKNCNTGSLR